jgi:hypothetical protein
LRTTEERLCAAAASTTVPAGYKLSISHCLSCGLPAAVAQNRTLAAVHFVRFLPSRSRCKDKGYFLNDKHSATKKMSNGIVLCVEW